MAHKHEVMKSHGEMMHKMSDTSDDDKLDCCAQECECLTSTCSTVVFLTRHSHSFSLSISSEIIVTYSSAHPYSISDSLYRPPIFA
jgi:hypothetical protein